MVITACLCPWPPILVRDLTGRNPVIPGLRQACRTAVRRLVDAQPELIVVAGPAESTRTWDQASRLDPGVFAPALSSDGDRLQSGGRRDPALPPSLGLGALLLDEAGYSGPRILQAVANDEPVEACSRLGSALSDRATRTGMLVMGDGSARRDPRAPGHLHPRAAAFDAATEQAMRRGDLRALLDVPPALARELMATGRPVWQVLAGAMLPHVPAADIFYAGAPFGVGYIVAFLQVATVTGR